MTFPNTYRDDERQLELRCIRFHCPFSAPHRIIDCCVYLKYRRDVRTSPTAAADAALITARLVSPHVPYFSVQQGQTSANAFEAVFAAVMACFIRGMSK